MPCIGSYISCIIYAVLGIGDTPNSESVPTLAMLAMNRIKYSNKKSSIFLGSNFKITKFKISSTKYNKSLK